MEDDDDFDEEPFTDMLGILPISYGQFLVTDTQLITDMLSNRWNQRNIEQNDSVIADKLVLYNGWLTSSAMEALKKYVGNYPDEQVIRSLSRDEWEAIIACVKGKSYGHMPSRLISE